MSDTLNISYYPIFEQGVFKKHPSLFDRFTQNTSAHMKKKFHRVRETMHQYEEVITWPLVSGPGFCGGTHPGADNVFVNIMVSIRESVDNGDCLYVNPSRKAFAVSDAPGVTTTSRRLMERLDHCLQEGSINDITTIINSLNQEMGVQDGATLSLICFPRTKSNSGLEHALVFIAGDTYIFHGNTLQRRLALVEGIPDFFGNPHIYIEPIRIALAPGDFFIIASDGILSIRGNNREIKLEDALLEHINDDIESFALNTIVASNRCLETSAYERAIARFGGSDNISVLLVYPEKLIDTTHEDSCILGGYTSVSSGTSLHESRNRVMGG